MRKILIALSIILFVACDRYDGDETEPSYLQLKAINVVDNPVDSWSQESGFFTSNINAVEITIWKEGDTKETRLGVFTLPCKIPVLRNGNIDKVRITPVVKQNGIAGSRIAYPYYESIELQDVRLAIDSLTDLDTLVTHYISKSQMAVRWPESNVHVEGFEPGPGNVALDSVVQRLTYEMDTVRSGFGCGVVRVPDSVESLSFWSSRTISVNSDEVNYLYLEMDYWSDFDFSVGLNNPQYSGGSNVNVPVMTIYGKPQAGWQKIYINLGKVWINQYFYYSQIRLYFTIFNDDHKQGNLFIDNMKVVTM